MDKAFKIIKLMTKDSLDVERRHDSHTEHIRDMIEEVLLKWHKLTRPQKLKKFAKYTSHELNFFLFNKDPKFFGEVV